MLAISSADEHELISIHETCGASEIAILCHGITSEKNEGGVFTAFANRLRAHDIDSLRFDFRGHGDSPIAGNDASISGMVLDLIAAIRACEVHYQRIHIVAASFGASVLLLAMKNFDFESMKLASVAMWNPVSNYGSTFFAATVPWGASFFPQGDLAKAVGEAPVSFGQGSLSIGPIFVSELFIMEPHMTPWPEALRLLMLHGKRDTLVNYRDTEQYHKQRAKSALLHLYPSADHGMDDVQSDVQQRTISFIKAGRTP